VVSSKIVLIGLPLKSWFNFSALAFFARYRDKFHYSIASTQMEWLTVADPSRHCQTAVGSGEWGVGSGEWGVGSGEKILFASLQKLYIHIFLSCIFLFRFCQQKDAGQEDVNR